MAASVLTLYLNNPQQSGSSAGLLDVNQPTASTSTTGWTVGKGAALLSSRLSFDQKVASGNFTSTAQASGAPITTAGHIAEDCWRLSAATSGTFSAGTWYSSLSVIAVSASGATGELFFRLWRSTDPGAASPTELTGGNNQNPTTAVSNLLTTVAQSSSASTHLGAITLTNEYLFFQSSWIITAAAGSNSADVLIRMGPITNLTNGSFLVTPVFTPTAAGAAVGTGFYTHRKHYELVN
jgi:hypothetical protein